MKSCNRQDSESDYARGSRAANTTASNGYTRTWRSQRNYVLQSERHHNRRSTQKVHHRHHQP
jgi:hypothetical protein